MSGKLKNICMQPYDLRQSKVFYIFILQWYFFDWINETKKNIEQ